MTLSDLQTYIGSLTKDPNHDRYSLVDINTELDNTVGQWNQEIKVIKEVTSITAVLNQRQYALTLISGTPLSFPRANFNRLPMKKRSKAYFDMNYGSWTLDSGTPIEYIAEATDPNNLYLTVYPTPDSGSAGMTIFVEAIIAHTPMVAATDVPFMLGTKSDYLLRPYDFYLGYSAAARLLARDPSAANQATATEYLKLSADGKANLTQVFKAMEEQEPPRMQGGRYWDQGNVKLSK